MFAQYLFSKATSLTLALLVRCQEFVLPPVEHQHAFRLEIVPSDAS